MDSSAFNNVVVAGGTGLVGRRPVEALMIHGALVTTAPHPFSTETFIRRVEEMLLNGSFVQPRRAGELGFRFRLERLEQALADLL